MREDRQYLALSRAFKYFEPSPQEVLSAAGETACGRWELCQEPNLPDLSVQSVGGTRLVIDRKYALYSHLGSGGMGSVYRVRHLLLEKEMALKTFRTSSLSPLAWTRFQREAQAIAKLSHQNIVQVFDCGIGEGNLPYFTMELLKGQSLADRLNTHGRLTAEHALLIFKSVASGLAHAHKHNIVHRDVKPGNIFLDQSVIGNTVVKVVDFGLAKLASSGEIDGQLAAGNGFVFGSPLYMSPEQATAGETDARSDIYSFGCAFFEALTGRPPFIGASAFETIQMHITDVAPRLSEANHRVEYDPGLESIVARLLAKDPRNRYQSFDHVLHDLLRLEVHPSVLSSESIEGRHPEGRHPEGRYPVARRPEDRHPVARRPEDRHPEDLHPEDRHARRERRNTSSLYRRSGPDIAPEASGRAWHFRLVGTGAFALAVLMVTVMTVIFAPKIQAIPQSSAIKLAYPFSSGFPSITAVSYSVEKPVRFSSRSKSGGRCFEFPKGTSLGVITMSNGDHVQAKDRVVIPRDQYLRFEASDVLTSRPELLAGFRAGDITEIACRDYMDWNVKFLEAIAAHLTSIEKIDLTGSKMGDQSIPTINKLNHLLGLSVGDTEFTGRGVAGLSRIRQFSFLDISQLSDASAVLRALQGSKHMQVLVLEDCKLTDDDIALICTMPNLVYLDLNHNSISVRGLSRLRCLSNLKFLHLADSSFNPGIIPIIHTMTKLKVLRIDVTEWPYNDVQKLQAALPPGCEVRSRSIAPGLKLVLTEDCTKCLAQYGDRKK